MSKPPLKGVPAELNRRLDELESATGEERVPEILAAVPPGPRTTPGTVAPPPAITFDSSSEDSLSFKASPDGSPLYEFAIRKLGTDGWNTLVTTSNGATFISLLSATKYEARVRLLNLAGGSGDWSAVVISITGDDMTPPAIPENLSLEADSFYIRAKVDAISQADYPDLAGYEFHASIASGFTPDDTTLKQVGISNRAIIHVTEAGQTWYVVARSFDKSRNYSEYCSEVLVLIPSTKIPTKPTDPTVEGEVNIVENAILIDNCDTIGDWESEQSEAIRISAAPPQDVAEGTGAIRVEVDKYNRKINQYIGAYNTTLGQYTVNEFAGQRFKAPWTGNCKRISIPLAKYGNPAPAVLHIYSDVAGDPGISLGSATLTQVAGTSWANATFAAAIALVDGTSYWYIIDSVVDINDYWLTLYSNVDVYLPGEGYGFGTGFTDALEARNPTYDMVFRLFDDTDCTGKHFKISSLSAKDLSPYDSIEFKIKKNSDLTGSVIKASMGEAALGEETKTIIGVEDNYLTSVWDIRGIVDVDIDAITEFGIEIDDPSDQTLELYFDNFRAVSPKKVNVKASDEVLQLYPCADLSKRRDWPAWESEHIVWDSGWVSPSGNVASRETWTHNLGYEADFWLLWCRPIGQTGAQIFPLQMDFHAYQLGHRIIGNEVLTTDIITHGSRNSTFWREWEATNSAVASTTTEYRLLGIRHTPDYEKGWTAVPALGSQQVDAHGLGVYPDFYMLSIGHPNIASRIAQGYCMMGTFNYSGNYPTVPVDVNGTAITWSVGNVQLCQFYDYSNAAQSIVAVAGWLYNTKAWVWPPDYVSGWTAISTTNRLLKFKHNLGEIPWLYMIEFSKAADGSNDRVPMMSTGVYSANMYDYGTFLAHLGQTYASVGCGSVSVASYEDSSGVGQNLASGYVRLKLWI